MDDDDDDVVFTCSPLFEINFTTEVPKYQQDDKDVLVHLGNKDFCLVRNTVFRGDNYQNLQIVLFILGEDNSLVDKVTINNEISLPDLEAFHPVFGFALPAFDSSHFVDNEYAITLDPNPKSRNEDVVTTRAELFALMKSYMEDIAKSSIEVVDEATPESENEEVEEGANITSQVADQVIQGSTPESENEEEVEDGAYSSSQVADQAIPESENEEVEEDADSSSSQEIYGFTSEDMSDQIELDSSFEL